MKIIISGGWSYGNIGDEVIFSSTKYLFEKYFHRAEIVFTSYDIDDFKRIHGSESVPSVHFFLENSKKKKFDYEYIMNNLKEFGLEEYSEMFDDNTVFVMSGGGYFVEEWKSQFVARLLEIGIAKAKGSKVILIGQSIGPIFSDYGKEILKKQLDLCEYIAVRDKDSVGLLESLKMNNHVHYFPDLAVTISDILLKHSNTSVIGIMPAAFSTYTAIDTHGKNKYIEKIKKRLPKGAAYKYELRKTIKALADRFSIQIILSTQWPWDCQFAKDVTKGLDNNRVSIIYCSTDKELCEKLSSVKYLISTKMHPLIIASAYGIPAIGISYNFKVDNFMEMIGRGDYCYRIGKISSSEIVRQVDKSINDEVDMKIFKERTYAMMKQLYEITGELDLK